MSFQRLGSNLLIREACSATFLIEESIVFDVFQFIIYKDI